MRIQAGPGPETEDAATDPAAAASSVRHDLITPVNHILGYCEILIEDAEDRGKVYRSRSVRSIQDLGRIALGAIDDATERAVRERRPIDIAAVGRALAGPCASVVEACRAIEEVTAASPDPAFLEDLARIKEAAIHLAWSVARWSGDQAGPRSMSSSSGSETARPERADR